MERTIIENGITAFDSFLKMSETKQEDIVNYLESYLSNVVIEGCSNLIRAIRRGFLWKDKFSKFKMASFSYLILSTKFVTQPPYFG